MKPRAINLIWGLILILGGGLFLAQNLGYIDESPQLWTAIFSGLSLLFFASYFLNGIQQWGWLFPACITAALALTIGLAEANVDGAILGLPVLIGVGLPFGVAYLLAPRQRGWALIPAWVLLAVSLVTLISERAEGELIGSLVLLAVALPFLAVYIGSPGAWWALIPGGTLASVALGLIAMNAANAIRIEEGALMAGSMFLGWAATFLVLWLRRASQPTGWAKYPALGLLVMSLIAFLAGTGVQFFWSVALIIGGVLVLLSNFRSKRQS